MDCLLFVDYFTRWLFLFICVKLKYFFNYLDNKKPTSLVGNLLGARDRTRTGMGYSPEGF